MINGFDLSKFIDEKVIERPSDFFQKDLVDHSNQLGQAIKGKSALVIGGAGTIGSSFIMALLDHKPKRVVVVDLNENGLAELIRDIRSEPGVIIPQDLRTYPIDFGGEVFYNLLEAEETFDIVANFAAHKHVRSEKDPYSIKAMIANNVFKTSRLLSHLKDAGKPTHFFAVSTDKAANPANVMGASKKLMENIILSYQYDFKVVTARFANVAFSNGSLPFAYLNRLAKSQPLSSPRNIKRYFISPKESGQLCLLACILGKSGNIFFPKLDSEKHMKTFTHIAEHLLESLGYEIKYADTEEEARSLSKSLKGSSSYPVYFFSSDTSGEKPYEEFYIEEEKYDLDAFDSLGFIESDYKVYNNYSDKLKDFEEEIMKSTSVSKEQIVKKMTSLIPTFSHIEKGKHLDQRM